MLKWEPLGVVVPEALTDARLQLHHAAQILASFGQTLVDPRPDDSHRSMTWDGARRVFRSEQTSDGSDLRLTLQPEALVLRALRGGAPAGPPCSLVGKTLDDGFDWAGAVLGGVFGRGFVALARPEYDLPAHAVSQGAAFGSDLESHHAELARWYSNTAGYLWRLAFKVAGASPVRCWPHHFDIATLVTMAGEDEDEARTIGVGMSPGDESYDQPYWYVSPYPFPAVETLPPLPGVGHWHTEGFVGAVLVGSELVASSDADAQVERARAFVQGAVKASRQALGC